MWGEQLTRLRRLKRDFDDATFAPWSSEVGAVAIGTPNGSRSSSRSSSPRWRAIAVLFVPSYTTAISDSDGNETIRSSTVWEVNGPTFLLVMAIPIAITILPLLVRGPSWPAVSVIAAVLIGLFAVIGSLSIGFYFIPAVAAELVAVFLPSRLPACPPNPNGLIAASEHSGSGSASGHPARQLESHCRASQRDERVWVR